MLLTWMAVEDVVLVQPRRAGAYTLLGMTLLDPMEWALLHRASLATARSLVVLCMLQVGREARLHTPPLTATLPRAMVEQCWLTTTARSNLLRVPSPTMANTPAMTRRS